mgnify:CR=1 FL=1
MAVDADNRVYNIEIQRSDKGAGAKEQDTTVALWTQM